MHFRISSSLSFQRKTKRHVFLLLFVLTPLHLSWPSYATGKCYRSPRQLISTKKRWWLYTRQNKLRVTSRSKQCNSFYNEMPVLIPISDCYNNLTDDTLGSDEQFSVKIFFSKKLIFEISKILIFNPKSLNFYSVWSINHFSIRLVKRAIINGCLTTLCTYSDSLRFFQYEISPLFFDPFPKSWWSAPKICNCDFEFACILNHHWCIVCQINN